MRTVLLLMIILVGKTAFTQEVKMCEVKEIPQPLEWIIKPDSFNIQNGTIEISAGPNTNMFYAPHGHFNQSNMPKLVFRPDSNFVFSANALAEHKSKWEAAMLIVYIDENYWAKFCFENEAPSKNRMVTVVTNEVSDDAYSDYVEGNSVYMQISKKGRQIVFSYSLDSKKWIGIRYFRLDSEKPIKIGFASQSPIGNGLTSVFSEIKYNAISK
ncbi:hypothetical protein GCM10023314_16130 [Algibacter agarivorans]|uniref:DUF1349 domain-containing protein n=1 Tax=Algibacter agarivorans TaxID=1109741 RepID=A0ABP9GIF0_9FLAO